MVGERKKKKEVSTGKCVKGGNWNFMVGWITTNYSLEEREKKKENETDNKAYCSSPVCSYVQQAIIPVTRPDIS